MKSFFKNIFSTIIGILVSIFILILLFTGSIALMSSEKEITIKENSILREQLKYYNLAKKSIATSHDEKVNNLLLEFKKKQTEF